MSATIFTKSDFENILPPNSFPVQNPKSDEHIYSIPLPSNHTIIVHSSINIRTNTSRDTGTDAIRINIINKSHNIAIFKDPRKHNRTQNWASNTSKHINCIFAHPSFYIRTCPLCNSSLVVRKKHNGKKYIDEFFGCSNFPNCRHTEPFNDPCNPNARKPKSSFFGTKNISSYPDPDYPHCPSCKGKIRVINTHKNNSGHITLWSVKCTKCNKYGTILNK